MTVAIDYIHVSGNSLPSEILGINVAVDNFMKAWFRYGKQENFICRAYDAHSFDHFKHLANETGIDSETRCIGLDPRTPRNNMETITCLFRPDPALSNMAWRRQQLESRGYAACGLVHSLSGEQVARTLYDLCLAPTDITDALICPSNAVRDALRKQWDIYSDYFNHRFGGNFKCPIQTPVIPIGIDTNKFSAITTPEKRQKQRQILNIADDEIVILFVGRLSFATKAHPLPVMLAAEQAAKNTNRNLRLIMYGYFKPQADMEPRYKYLANDICQNIKCDFITNDDSRFPDGLWAAADIFTSLVENVQESFGLTPIEAMACGLPTVVTDWDGYRDGVRNGKDGFLIPTYAPPASAGQIIAENYYNENNYGSYLTGASQSTAIDISAAAKAFVTLADDDAKRHTMRLSGRAHAIKTYDWSAIIPAYEALWQQQEELRGLGVRSPALPKKWPAAHPAYVNPWEVFDGFPSAVLSPSDRLLVVMSSYDITTIMKHDMNLFIPELLLPSTSLRELIEAIRGVGSVRIQDMLAGVAPPEHARLWRCFGWMLKHGICVREV